MNEPLKLSVGVVAWNEESGIAAALESILKQTIFRNARSLGYEVELIVIANGCTDGTVEAADAFFEKMRGEFPQISGVRLRLEEAAEAGVANAWNLLAHTYSRPDADFIYLVNADIVIDRPEALEWMLNELQKDPQLRVVSPIGHAEKRTTLCDRLSPAAARLAGKNHAARFRGHCFCARAAALRSVWLPKRFPGAEDEVFRRMILSDMASSEEQPERIGLALNAGYTVAESCTFADAFNRRVRRVVGQAFIETLMGHLKTMRAEQPGVNVTAYLRARDANDPSWLHRLVQLNIHVKGLYAAMPSPWLRFRKDPGTETFKQLVMLPVAVIALAVDIPVFLAAAWRLKTGRVSNVWKDTKHKNPAG